MVVRFEVVGTGSYLPERVVKNADFEGRDLFSYLPDGSRDGPRRLLPEKIYEVTGVNERRYALPHETPSSMGLEASRLALISAGLDPKEVGGVILATVSENRNYPSGAAKIARDLGIRGAYAFDVNNACAGFGDALRIASGLVHIDPRPCLVIGAEKMTSMVDWTDINSTLFGDGAGAFVLKSTDSSRGILGAYSMCDPHGGKSEYIFRDIERGNVVRMPHGSAVLKRAVSAMVDASAEAKKLAGWDNADVYIAHQANERILKGVADRVSSEGAAVYRIIEKTGNMSAATCPVAFDRAVRDGTIRRGSGEDLGSKVVLTSFGSGLTVVAVPIQN